MGWRFQPNALRITTGLLSRDSQVARYRRERSPAAEERLDGGHSDGMDWADYSAGPRARDHTSLWQRHRVDRPATIQGLKARDMADAPPRDTRIFRAFSPP